MKRRGFFRCALALLGLKALGKRLWPERAMFTAEFVIDVIDKTPEGWEWVDTPPCECGGNKDCPKCLGIVAILERKGSHLHVS